MRGTVKSHNSGVITTQVEALSTRGTMDVTAELLIEADE
jgi:hypothetical protein